MIHSASKLLQPSGHQRKQIWLLALVAMVLGLSLLLVSRFVQQIVHNGLHNLHASSLELLIVCSATLVLFKLVNDEHRDNKRHRKEILRNGAIREHENLLKGRAEAMDAHAIVSITSPTGYILYANENFREFFGYGDGSLNSASNDQLYPGGANNPTHMAISQAMHAGKTWQGKQCLEKLNGDPVTMFATVIPVKDELGQRTHNICIRTDVTESDRTDRQKMLSQLMGDLQEEVYVYEVNNLALIYANKAACTRCNWSPENLDNLSIADSSRNFDASVFREHTQPLIDEERETVTINTVHEKGPVEITTRIVLTQAGKQVFVSVLRDMSEHHRLEQARLESLSEASHELRSPLTSIKGSLRLLEGGVIGPLPDKATELVSMARRNTDRLIGMVNNVLDYEKLKSGTMDVERCPIDLNDVMRKSVEMMVGYSDQYKVNIELVLPKQSSLVNGNEDRLVQVVVNLISNAVKHSPENSSIVTKIIRIENDYRVSVEDEGPGVPKAARDVIFESFGQVDALDGIKRHGTGLGLAISQKILKIHNANMELDLEREKGSFFYFDLPSMDVTCTPEMSGDFG